MILALALALVLVVVTVAVGAAVVAATGRRRGRAGPGMSAGPEAHRRPQRGSATGPGGTGPTTGPWSAEAGDAARLAALARALGLVVVAPGRLEGRRQGLPVTVNQLRPTLRLRSGTSAKTGIETRFADPAPVPFRVHGRGPAVVGAQVTTGDPEFDRRFVVRSSSGNAALELFGETARKAITAYGELAPAVDVTEHRVQVLIEGPLPESSLLERLIDLQVEVVAALGGP